MSNLNNYDFGPEDINLSESIVFERFLSEHNHSISKSKAEILCKAIIQLQNINKKPFVLDRLRGSTFDSWNLYVEDKNVFCISEARCGYTLHYFDDSNIDIWFNDFCQIALNHSAEFGRNT